MNKFKVQFSIFLLILNLVFVFNHRHGHGHGHGPRHCDTMSITTASGSSIKRDEFCSGELIFEDNFDKFDFEKWQHENTLAGGGNWEFQWYTNNRTNSFTKDGKLYIRPTLTSDIYGESFLSYGVIDVNGGAPADQCTNPSYWGCSRTGTEKNILNPIRSARIRTVESFNFKYGKIEVKAKLPAGDWLWPAIWLMPKRNAYGSWPASGEIDIMESRGNRNLSQNGTHIGTEQFSSTLHYGPDPSHNAWATTHFDYNSAPGKGYDKDFHLYQLEWTPEYLKFKVDDEKVGTINAGEGFWKRGEFPEGMENTWTYGDKMSPFDQEFYIIINLAVGGTNWYFPDDVENPGGKPWNNTSNQALTDFWNGRDQWLPTWNLTDINNEENAFQVEYVKVFAL